MKEPTSTPAPTPTPAPIDGPSAHSAAVLSLINTARAAQGLLALGLSEPLGQAAQTHAADMTSRGYFAYNQPGGDSGVQTRINATGYRGRTGVNLSRGWDDPAEVVAALLGDLNTRESLLSPGYSELGVGESQAHWTLILGAPLRTITPELQQRAADLLNLRRTAAGVAPVELSPALNYAAQRHSLDQARRGTPSTLGSDGSTAALRVREAGYDGTADELLASERELEAALTDWLADPAAQRTLLAAPARHLGVGLADGMLTLLCGVPATAVVNTDAELQGRVLALLNEHRQSIRVAPLTLHPGLCAAAASHSQDMADKSFFAFEQPGQLGIAGHLKHSGYRGRTLPAITMGQTTAEAVVQLLLGNAAHRRNLLDADNRDLGVAVTRARWTLVLGNPPAEASDDLRGRLLALLNAQRALSTAPPLRLSVQLAAVAQAYAEDMARRNYFAFQTPEGEPLTAQAQRSGFDGRLAPALVKGYTSPEAALDTWMKSPANRQNILDPQLVQLGIGVADSRWVLLLGAG